MPAKFSSEPLHCEAFTTNNNADAHAPLVSKNVDGFFREQTADLSVPCLQTDRFVITENARKPEHSDQRFSEIASAWRIAMWGQIFHNHWSIDRVIMFLNLSLTDFNHSKLNSKIVSILINVNSYDDHIRIPQSVIPPLGRTFGR